MKKGDIMAGFADLKMSSICKIISKKQLKNVARQVFIGFGTIQARHPLDRAIIFVSSSNFSRLTFSC